MKIVWDEPKRAANVAKHGLDFADLTSAFFEAALVIEAKKGRFQAFGRFKDISCSVVFRLLGTEALSVISLRPASLKERVTHDLEAVFEEGRESGDG